MFFIFRNYNQEILDRLELLENNMFYLYERNKKKLNYLIEKEERMSNELINLEAEVAETNEVMASAIMLIEGIAAKLEAAGTDPVKLAALTISLNSSSEALAAAVAVNTIAEDEVEVIVDDEEEVIVEDEPVVVEEEVIVTEEPTV